MTLEEALLILGLILAIGANFCAWMSGRAARRSVEHAREAIRLMDEIAKIRNWQRPTPPAGTIRRECDRPS